MKMIDSSRWIMAVAVLGLVVGLGACKKKTQQKPDKKPTAEETADDGQKKDMTKSVVLYDGNFNPASLTVPKGTKVVFKNKDREKHNVKIAALDIDENLEPNDEWSYTFETTGEFAVENRLSTEPMKMTIIVK